MGRYGLWGLALFVPTAVAAAVAAAAAAGQLPKQLDFLKTKGYWCFWLSINFLNKTV